MGVSCSQCCAGCAPAENQAETLSMSLSEFYVEEAIDQSRPSMEYGKVEVFTCQKRGLELPRLMLRRSGDSFREQEAMAKVVASPYMSARTSRSEWSTNGTECMSPQRAPITPMITLQENTNEIAVHPQGVSRGSLEVIFDADGKEATCLISRRPLGAEVCKRPFGPTEVTKVSPRGHAWELGIRCGWSLKKIGGQDVTDKSFEYTHEALAAGLINLPCVAKA